MKRVRNFAAGPAALPLSALELASRDLLDFEDTGIGIAEQPHRYRNYENVQAEAESLFRELLNISNDYDVLFLQGGARMQFAVVPMNFLPAGKSADYILTGTWSQGALDEARLVGQSDAAGRVAATVWENDTYRRIPREDEINLDSSASYVHITSNNTVYGSQWQTHASRPLPDTKGVPLVADMTSDILSRRLDVSRFGLIYAGAQKNLGPAGLTMVIVRKDWVAEGNKKIPKIFQYRTFAANQSMFNTPPTLSIYLMRNVLRVWKERGIEQIEAENLRKAQLVYGTLEKLSSFYELPVEKESRSLTNAVFRLHQKELEKAFLSQSEAAGFLHLKGHRSVGGMRISMYNAIRENDVQDLMEFVKDFAQKNG